MDNFIELTTKELLEKFGEGKPTPGSGSAAALLGMISAKLIQTVINLTRKQSDCSQWMADLNKMGDEVENRIFPTLENLFQLDSEQFKNVIRIQGEIKKEKNIFNEKRLQKEADGAMLLSTETPIIIAKLCVELSNYGLFLFDNGFQSVRGDSGVALNNAISSIGGCLSIINLNLLSLGHNGEIEHIRNDAKTLKVSYHDLSSNAIQRLESLEKEVERNKQYHKELNALSSGQWVDASLSYGEIENIARRLQNFLWKYHIEIFKQPSPENLIDILNPQAAFMKILNYQYSELASLGLNFVEGETFEIAGIIDNSNKSVFVSKNFSKETQNFTAAHELGHALLHRQLVLHRDRALDGFNMIKDPIEISANKFAAFFLMPKNQVEGLFKQFFFTNKFTINPNTIFGLTKNSNVYDFKKKCTTLRELCRILASAEFYGSHSFKSLAELFHVSIETMAIRLEELGLAQY